MPLYSVDTQKQLGSEFWTNRYIVSAPTLAVGVTIGLSLIDAERPVHSNMVNFINYRVSDMGPSEEYTVQPVNLLGLRQNINLLPLFNTLRVDIAALTGRPSRKFYRGVLGEEDIAGDIIAINPTFLNVLTALEAQFVASVEDAGLVDPQGTWFTSASFYPYVQMRQLRRGKRRRTTPVFQ